MKGGSADKKRGIYNNSEVDYAVHKHFSNEEESRNSESFKERRKKLKNNIFQSFQSCLDPHEKSTVEAYVDRLINSKGLSIEEAWERGNEKIKKILERKQ